MTSPVLRLADRQLLNAVANGRTPSELEEEFAGYTAVEIYARVKEILSSFDVWDEQEQRKLLVLSLQDLKRKAEIHLDIADAKSVNALRDVILAIDKIASSNSKITEEEIRAIVREQTSQMMSLIAMSWGATRAMILQNYPAVQLEELDGVFYSEFARNYNATPEQLEGINASPRDA